MNDEGGIDAMWLDLARQLAALRRAARLTQVELGILTKFSRTTVSVVEIGRVAVTRDFWRRAIRRWAQAGC
jgi:hypothetical protein